MAPNRNASVGESPAAPGGRHETIEQVGGGVRPGTSASPQRAAAPPLSLPLLLGAVAILVATAYAIHLERDHTRQYWEARLAGGANAAEALVLGWLHERNADARVLAINPIITETIQTTSPDASRLEVENFIESTRSTYGYLGIDILDARGEALIRAGHPFRDQDIEPPGMELAIDVVTAPGRSPLLTATAPVRGGSATPGTGDRPIGFVRLVVDVASRLEAAIHAPAPRTSTGETVVLFARDGVGYFLVPPREDRDHPDRSSVPIARLGSDLQAALAGEEGFGVYTCERGNEVFAATTRVPILDWAVVRRIDGDEALGASRQRQQLTAAAGGFVLLALGVLVRSRRQRLELEHVTRELAHERRLHVAEDSLRQHARRLDALLAIDRAIISAEAPAAIAASALKKLPSLLPCDESAVAVFHGNGTASSLLAHRGFDAGPMTAAALLDPSVLGHEVLDRLRRGEAPLVDAGEAGSAATLARAMVAAGIQAALIFPFLAGHELFGVIAFFWRRAAPVSEQQREVAAELATQLAVAVHQARLRQQVQRDAIELEQRVRERTRQLQDANDELEAFSFSVSHDLRAPMRRIRGWSQAVLEDHGAKLDREVVWDLERIHEASLRLSQLIDDLLGLSRVGRAELHWRDIDLSALARDVAEELARADSGRTVGVEIAPDLAARGDPRLMRIVLENLIGNAWKYTGRQPAPRIEFGRAEQDGEQVFFVRDNGAGFDPRDAERLFVAFQRLHSIDEFEGNGIGLATVQRIVHRHGGRVWAAGAVDEGATFYFTLGAAPSVASAGGEAGSSSGAAA